MKATKESIEKFADFAKSQIEEISKIHMSVGSESEFSSLFETPQIVTEKDAKCVSEKILNGLSVLAAEHGIK